MLEDASVADNPPGSVPPAAAAPPAAVAAPAAVDAAAGAKSAGTAKKKRKHKAKGAGAATTTGAGTIGTSPSAAAGGDDLEWLRLWFWPSAAQTHLIYLLTNFPRVAFVLSSIEL